MWLTARPSPEGQLGVHPRPAISAAGLLVNCLDVLEQQLVLLRADRLRSREPFVVALTADIEHPTGHRDVETVAGEFVDQREDYFGRTFSRAK